MIFNPLNKPRSQRRSGCLFRSLLLTLSLLTFFHIEATAGQASGELFGQVADELGGLVVGADVKLTDSGGATRATTTDHEGRYRFAGLAHGRYAVRVEAIGFAVYESAAVEVEARGRERFNIKLGVTLGKEEVTVGADSTLSAAADNNASAIVLGSSELDSLPDDPDSLSAALLALAGPSAGPNGGQIIVDGFTDGRLPARNSIREVRINTNPFSAEYTRLGFGRIEVFTRPGMDKFHGQASVNFSDESLNSRNPFASIRAPYRYLLYGGNLSGPVVSKRASFFLDFERRDIDDNNIINATTLDSSLNVTPFGLAIPAPHRRTSFSPRFDYQIDPRHTLVARYTFLRQSQENAGVGNFSLLSRAHSIAYAEQSAQLTETAVLNARAVNETRIQYSRQKTRQSGDDSLPTINVLDAFTGGGSQIGLARNTQGRFEVQNNTTLALNRHTLRFGATLRHLRVNDISPLNFGGTYIFAGGVASLLDANNQPIPGADGQPVRTVINSIERYRRTLLLQRQGFTAAEIRERGGGATQFSIVGGDPFARIDQTEFGLFIQDEWNVRPDFTLSAGLRYDGQSNCRCGFNVAPRFSFAFAPGAGAGAKIGTVIRGGFGIFFDRVGENLSLQAQHLDGLTERQYISAAPDILGLFPAVPSLALLAGSSAPPTSVRLAPDIRLPYLMQGALSIERQLPLKFVVTATLLSTRGLHLLRSRNINAPLPGTFLPGLTESGTRPLGDARGNIFQYESSGRFNQNQLIVSLRNPVSSHVSIIAAYVLNKARGDTDGPDTFPVNSYNLGGEYGRSALDVRQRLTLTGVISLKHGFSLNPFILASAGRPFNIITGLDANGDTQFTERPSFAAGPTQSNVTATRFGVFNSNPSPGEQLVPRNYGTSPAFLTVSLRASKTWGFGGEQSAAATASPSGNTAGAGSMLPDTNRSSFFGNGPNNPYRLTLSVVARNIFNRTNPGRTIGNLNASLFGQSNFLAPPFGFGEVSESSAANRRVEFQLRFSW